jgi:inhibitor of cysteine peptidase
MVTFRQVDPLFVIDTSNPRAPQLKGMLKIPGYSTYLHMVDEDHILGFGYDTEESQWGGTVTGGLKISMFDVSNVNKPKETFTEVIGRGGKTFRQGGYALLPHRPSKARKDTRNLHHGR